MDNPKHSSLGAIAFVVEPSNAISAHLTADLTRAGYRAGRVSSVNEAMTLCSKFGPELILANLSLPNQTAWQLASTLALHDSGTRLLLYGHDIAVHHYAMADFLGIERLIEYSNDLSALSATLQPLFDNRRDKAARKRPSLVA
ncbi:response regulator [Novipirellula artificiosorum]|uniref:Response regulatory domain-containing protein n=1 Tax=Novipirellula artificiosorum TaxID=2528016 RepID=A0A5C6DQ79_9BACT|nr:hypothetical protein [Novipirellula artificiosorum]TWU39433.1 hypothetical protein Poly41_22570 [Novipirellula artificiosorum]